MVVFVGQGNHGWDKAVIVVGESFAAYIAAFYAGRTGWRNRSLAWWSISVAMFSWGTGQMAWAYYQLIAHRVAPFPSMADFGYLALVPFAIVGVSIICFEKALTSERVRAVLDGLVIAVSLMSVAWVLALEPVFVARGETTLFALVLSFTYPVGDIVVVAVVLTTLLRVGLQHRQLRLLGLGFAILAVADGLFSYLVATGTVSSYTLSDVGWFAGFLVVALSAATSAEVVKPAGNERPGSSRLFLVFGPLTLAIGVSLAELLSGPRDAVLVYSVLALAIVAMGRQLAVQLENAGLTVALRARLLELERSQARFRAVFDESKDVVCLISDDGCLIEASAAMESMLFWPLSQVRGRYLMEFVHPDDLEKVQTAFVDFLGGYGASEGQFRFLDGKGNYRWIEGGGSDLREHPAVQALVVSLHDIGERVRSQSALHVAQQRFQAAFDEAPIGMALATMDGRFIMVNRSLHRILGYAPGALVGMSNVDITHQDDLAHSRLEMQRLGAGEISGYQLEKRYIHADGHTVWVALSVSMVAEPDGESYVVGQIEDITQRKAIAEHLEHSAVHDALTGLPNRVYFVGRLDEALRRAEREGTRIGVVFLDVDRFKVVNDSLGHAAGDELLKAVADRLRESLRPDDVVARFGGDEFTVLVERVADEAAAMEMADRVLRILGRPVNLSHGETYVSASLGVAISEPGTSGAELLRNADTAMYVAKQRGRGRVELFAPLSHTNAVSQLRTENDLHRALERREFRLHYQPIVDLRSGQVVGFEALVRWQHPTRGLLAPGEFIGLAEETGLIVPIGAWVLEQACAQTARWQKAQGDRDPVTINVNLSPPQLGTYELTEQVRAVLARTGIRERSLCLEITESGLMVDTAEALARLSSLHALGVRLSIDDFGTGYSSLTYLKRFPVDSLKIDRTFVDGLGTEPEDTAIVSAVIGLAHSLGLVAVAEGVETVEQLTRLRAMGCDLGQGYYFGRPVPAAALGDDPCAELHSWQLDGRWVPEELDELPSTSVTSRD